MPASEQGPKTARMMKLLRRPAPWAPLALSLFLLVSLAAPAVQAQSGLVTFERDELTIETAAGERHSFDVEMALEPAQQAQGLMYRREMAERAGMLFVVRPARVLSMWMKNTFIPLDMLFIDADGRITKVVERTVPMSLTSISSDRPVNGVLELNAGTASRLTIGPGDRVLHPAFGKAP